MSEKQNPIDRFFAKVDKSGECWIWLAGPQFTVNGARINPRRFSYETHTGRSSGRILLDLSCGERQCVNPSHISEHKPVHHEHGHYLRYFNGCRCKRCKAAHNERQREQNAERASRPKDPNDPRHGTASFYTNHGCRCTECTATWIKSTTLAYQRRIARTVDPNDARHGKPSFYFGHGCRCERCRKAAADYYQERKTA